MMRAVLVTHPGRQHSHRAALALHRAGALRGYWAGVPFLESSKLARWLSPYAPVALPADGSRCAPWVPGLRKLGALLPNPFAARLDFAACRAFDRWVAARLPVSGAGAVLACEISALATFRRARELGMVTLLDAPAIHHAAQDRWHGFTEPASVHRRVVEVKDEEIALADGIVTVSELARRTYVEAGVPPEKVIAVALGADLGLFGGRERKRGGPCRFLFAGAPIERKGFDLLVEGLERLHAKGLGFHLRLAGPRGELSHLVQRLPAGFWSEAGRLSQEALAVEMAGSDALVLPSRNDSYGMVVAEALAAGLPAVVSDRVGAAELIREGETGWVVPAGEVEALSARLEAIALTPEIARGLEPHCRARAEGATWDAYEERFVEALRPWLEEAGR